MASLKSDVEKKLYPLKRNLCEIIKVETAVAGYPEVLKADIILLDQSRPGVVPFFTKLNMFARKTQSRSGQTKSSTRQCLLIFQLFLVLLRRP